MDYSTTTTEKLRKTEAMLNIALKVYAGLSLVAAIILFVLKAKFIFFVPLLGSSTIFISLGTMLKTIKTELKSRSKVNS